jgi:hypothetical protein
VQTLEGLEYAGAEILQPEGEEQQNLGMVLVVPMAAGWI